MNSKSKNQFAVDKLFKEAESNPGILNILERTMSTISGGHSNIKELDTELDAMAGSIGFMVRQNPAETTATQYLSSYKAHYEEIIAKRPEYAEKLAGVILAEFEIQKTIKPQTPPAPLFDIQKRVYSQGGEVRMQNVAQFASTLQSVETVKSGGIDQPVIRQSIRADQGFKNSEGEVLHQIGKSTSLVNYCMPRNKFDQIDIIPSKDNPNHLLINPVINGDAKRGTPYAVIEIDAGVMKILKDIPYKSIATPEYLQGFMNNFTQLYKDQAKAIEPQATASGWRQNFPQRTGHQALRRTDKPKDDFPTKH